MSGWWWQYPVDSDSVWLRLWHTCSQRSILKCRRTKCIVFTGGLMLPNSQASLSPMKINVCFCMLLSTGILWKFVPHCWPCVPKRRHSGDTKIDRVYVAVQDSPVCIFNSELICYQLISQWFIRFLHTPSQLLLNKYITNSIISYICIWF